MNPCKTSTPAHLLILFLLTLTSCQSMGAEVRIAVAANFTEVSRQLAELFERETGYTTRISYGSTGKLFAQIENGAPFDLFLSADTQRPEKAEKEGLAVAGSRFNYAKGKLVLWSSESNLFKTGENYLKTASFQHIALANPKTAPYGLAAREVLEKLGIWQKLNSTNRLVRGESIAQTFQFVATGNTQAGFVAFSQIKAWQSAHQQTEAGTTWEISTEYYNPINQAAVLLERGKTNPAAQAYLKFLDSENARTLIRSYGYDVDDKP